MEIIISPEKMSEYSQHCRSRGQKVALVPTMGALHSGHLSLLDVARREADVTVMSIFVNPTQFGPSEDFSKYPRQFEEDCRKAEAAGCDVIFAPTKEMMYPVGYNTFVSVENITEKLCGASRPGHFRGVTTVVLKFFNIVNPHTAVFGQKDAQQVLVIKRMVEDLNHPVKIVVAPIMREHDGLAMSSRNIYLTKDERIEVPVIKRALDRGVYCYEHGERQYAAIKNEIYSVLNTSKMLSVEYVEIVDTVTVQPVEIIPAPALIAVACRTTQSKTRLIDNVIVGGSL
ncbi:MAG TPA: pantoate--beta-alanine ligase [Chitinispirillaceae bacterium]|nr:pantoate--beta-alanine ligase [Chitinispirillaceae bacterium]